MTLSSSDTKEVSKHKKLRYKIPDKYITCWLGCKKNPYKDKFQMTNHFRKVLVSPKMSTSRNPIKALLPHKTTRSVQLPVDIMLN